MSKSLLIDPHKREITVTEDMTEYCPGGITLACVTKLGEPLYVDDEGLLRPEWQPGFRCPKLRSDDQPLLGYGILQGPDRHEIRGGKWVEWVEDVTTTPEQMAEMVEWMSVDDVVTWFHNNSSKLASYIQDESGGITPLSTYGDFLFRKP